jgi:hypothetical protein
MALVDNLVSVWCEAAAPTTDEFGSETLTDNGSVGTTTGVVGTAGLWTTANTTQWLSHADDAALSSGDIDFTVAAWVYLTSKSKSYPTILGKVSSDAGTIEYQLLYRSSVDQFEWAFGGPNVRATTFGSPSLNTWYYIVAYHDATANTVGICVNNGTVNTAADSGGTDTTKGFAIGTLGEYHDSSSTWDGRLNQVAMWKRVVGSTDLANLYNSGVGLPFASWAGGASLVGTDGYPVLRRPQFTRVGPKHPLYRWRPPVRDTGIAPAVTAAKFRRGVFPRTGSRGVPG